MIVIGAMEVSLALVGLVLIFLAWLIQLIAVYRRKTKTIRRGFVIWYIVGMTLLLVDLYDGSFLKPIFVIQAGTLFLVVLIFLRVKR